MRSTLAPERASTQQSSAKIPRVGILSVEESERAPKFDAFRAGLRDLGYIEGRNIILEFRLAGGNLALGPQLATELAALPVDVIVTEGLVDAAVAASGYIPIVAPAVMDPVQRGFASSLARPDRNFTGFTLMHAELNAKRLDLLRKSFPHITAVAALVDPANPSYKLAFEQTETAARLMGLGGVVRAEAGSGAALRELRPAVFLGANAVVIIPDGMFYAYRRDVVALINAARLPAIYPEREYADEGGLMAYGTNVPDNFRRAASYVDRILKGAKAGDLPIQEPVRIIGGIVRPSSRAVLRLTTKSNPAWDDMPEALKPILRRQMEVYAGFLEYTDHHVGRLLDGLRKINILDDTLVYYIIGDNGASAEGTLNGAYNEMANFNGLAALETPEFLMARYEKLGGPESHNHYAVGWAHAMNAPYQWTKQVASHWGGTRTGTIVHWPNGIKVKGEIRSQFHHVIDIAPTILEAAGLPEPVSVNGVQQRPIEGVSMLYSFDDAKAAERRETQYFEILGNRGIYHKGWTAVTRHGTPWVLVGPKTVALDDDVWELYDTIKDWSQANDLSKQMPEKLHELQRLWLIEATRYNVLPIDDRVAEKLNPDIAGRPVLIKGNTQLLFRGMGRLSENCVLNVKNKSRSVTAEIEVPEAGAEGVIIAQGANIGGWSLYAKNGKLKYCYNVAGVNHYYVEAGRALPAGEHQVRMEFAYAGGGLGKGGQVTLYVDGEKVGEGAIPMTQAMVFSADDGCDVGEDSGAPVSQDYGSRGNAFNGTVKGVQLAISDAAESSDHLVSPEDAIRIARARQ